MTEQNDATTTETKFVLDIGDAEGGIMGVLAPYMEKASQLIPGGTETPEARAEFVAKLRQHIPAGRVPGGTPAGSMAALDDLKRRCPYLKEVPVDAPGRAL